MLVLELFIIYNSKNFKEFVKRKKEWKITNLSKTGNCEKSAILSSSIGCNSDNFLRSWRDLESWPVSYILIVLYTNTYKREEFSTKVNSRRFSKFGRCLVVNLHENSLAHFGSCSVINHTKRSLLGIF